ncbi:NTP-PPase_u4 domain containing protein [uncultured Caudovirales phage]|uniref:NTP-PPase_u4 domain containing protein n=1 Tax=uncultured Caudovirales phage TaxID=2100421 RepID=A0A6J5MUJ8_9CAUD|nr:NTP-PPase_u4 domain containing protein [uncultured Caudovirales phage]
MTKDEAVSIAYDANNMTLARLLDAYGKFHDIVENTPNWLCGPVTEAEHTFHINDVEFGKPHNWQQSLHGSIGLCTEAAELLDAHKKELYGKNKPLRPDNIREECGDVFFYLHLVMKAHGFTLHDILKDNVVKLANRYIDKFEV